MLLPKEGIALKQFYQTLEEWMVKYKKNSVKTATYDRMLVSFKLMKNYKISYVYLDKLCSDDIQEYINHLVKDGYALTTIKKQYNLITGFIKYANVEGLISRPLYHNVKLPSQSVVHKPKRDVVAYNDIEQMNLRRVLKTHARIEYDVATFMMETGTRIGEALAICWRDINWARRSIRIDKTLVRLCSKGQTFLQNEAKSYSSNRTIPLSTDALTLLKYLYEKEDDPSGYVFHDENGNSLTYEAMRWHITIACRQAKVPYFGQHVFRHTFATNCYHRGCDVKVLSKLLGHADVTVTYNTYIHLFGDNLEEMRKVLE